MTDDVENEILRRYRELSARVEWVPVIDTDFNRGPRLIGDRLVWNGIAFVYEDGTGGVQVNTTVFLGVGSGSGVEGTPGILCRVIEVDPAVREWKSVAHANGSKDWYQRVRVTPVDWSVL